MRHGVDEIPGDRSRRLIEVSPEQIRVLLTYAMGDLALLRMSTDEIQVVWEESDMPLPAFVQQRYVDGRRDVLAALLRRRFGGDDCVGPAAERLAAIDPEEALALIEEATQLIALVDA